MSQPLHSRSHNFWLAVLRAGFGRCPRCGKGRLFTSYLKPVACCSVCGESYGHIRADDGPAWLTIVIVGHILGVTLLAVVPDSDWPDWVSLMVWPGLAFLLAMIILPRAKGLFIALIWRNNSPGAEL